MTHTYRPLLTFDDLSKHEKKLLRVISMPSLAIVGGGGGRII